MEIPGQDVFLGLIFRERERETLLFSVHPFMLSLVILVCALTRDRTNNLGVSDDALTN